VSPVPHVHAALMQLAPVAHAVPQLPQSNGSVCRSTHALLQLVKPLEQLVVHAACEHTWLLAQRTPHPPQFLGSLWVLVQTPEQRIPLL
jgi:hypothetical protein